MGRWAVGARDHALLTGPASSGSDVAAHAGGLVPDEIVEVQTPWQRPVRTTSLERTVVDCARTLDFERAVVIADHALRLGADPRKMQDYLDNGRITRGARRLRRVLEFMDARSALQAQGWKVVRIEWDDLSRPWDVDRKLREALDGSRVERRKPAVPLPGSNGTAGQRRNSGDGA